MIALNPNAIDGIHNYCDRWCERCSFTSRCNVFENTSDLTPEELDIRSKAFWDRLSRVFQDLAEELYQAAAERGIDLTKTTPESEELETRQKQTDNIVQDHPLAKMSSDYGDAALEWLRKTQLTQEKGRELNQSLELGILTEEEADGQAKSLDDGLEVIQWYLYFIHVKLVRALSGKEEDDGWEADNGFQNDFDGSAKIALIAIDRTMQAWITLMGLFRSEEDSFLQLLSMLQKIKSMTEKEFPNARNFVRPGFDE